MTTARQIRKLIEPLLARNGDLALIDRWIMLKPVRHVLRGVLIDRTGEASRFRPTWAISHLCEPSKSLPLNWGQRIRHGGHHTWTWDDPSMPADLYGELEDSVLPFLRGIETLDDFVATTGPDRFQMNHLDLFPLRKIIVDVARGQLKSGRSICASLRAGGTMWSAPDLREEFSRIVDALCPLLAADDRMGLARQLRAWEAYTARNLKIESIWEPTPFPLELQSH